ncbi:peroxisomal biogenesis factor 2 [Diplodia corticola]|uniref:Peroxisomal biogenesis factor 2 n=1 Tax=Diplodia corticola TaxID=236234 RepID=A0A1J9R5B2_9PEZI|nr:peroxisomal biogenesis factor 2 [Diplodia corticola]OJD36686.1 peroxisomal biogenesis factor 2 [Diplodia corticola]
MSSADFAAAQQRLQQRRQQRERDYRARVQAQRNAHHQQRIQSLPYPLSRLGGAGLTLWDAIKGRDGTQPAFRVGQVDAELLDEELLELLKGQVGEALKYFGSHLTDDHKPEILLALRLILFKLSIWDHNASYGAALQGLRYTDARAGGAASLPPPQPWQKASHGLLTIGGRYAWTKWEAWLSTRSHSDPPPSPSPHTNTTTPSPSRQSLLPLAARLTSALSTAHSFAALASFLVFLANGRYRTLADRLLRLRLAPATAAGVAREVSFEYLNRQLVWHAFTEFLLFLLPLVGVARWRRMGARAWRRGRGWVRGLVGWGGGGSGGDEGDGEDGEGGKGGELGFLPERTCAVCYAEQNLGGGGEQQQQALLGQQAGGSGVVGSAATDVTNPYQAVPCGCVYCFVCLAQKIEAEEGEGWTCLRCGEVVTACRPWDGDVIVEHQGQQQQQGGGGEAGGRPASSGSGNGGKSVGFAATADDEKRSLRQLSPAPTLDEREREVGGTLSADAETEQSLLGSRALTESEEWARASRIVEDDEDSGESVSGTSNGSEDEQSEEIDEEEDEIEFDE